MRTVVITFLPMTSKPTHYHLSPSCPLDDRSAIIEMMGPGPYRFERYETIRNVPNIWLRVEGGPEYAISVALVDPCPKYHLSKGSRSFLATVEQAKMTIPGNPKRIEGWGVWVCRFHNSCTNNKFSIGYEWTYCWAPLDIAKHAGIVPALYQPVHLISGSISTLAA